MSLLDKVKALFAEATPETIFVKTVDGQILLVKAPKLDLNVEIVAVDEAGVEQPLKDGDYVLEDNTNLSVLDGKIAEIATAEEETEEEMEVVKMAVIKQVNKWALDIDQEAIEVGTILTRTYVEQAKQDGVAGEPCPIASGEYEMENGDLIQVDSDGKVVLITPAKVEKPETPVEPSAEQMSTEKTIEELKAKVAELESALVAKEELVAKTEEAFNKLKSEPAAKPIDKKKFEKIEKPTQYTMLEKVSMIINKNK